MKKLLKTMKNSELCKEIIQDIRQTSHDCLKMSIKEAVANSFGLTYSRCNGCVYCCCQNCPIEDYDD